MEFIGTVNEVVSILFTICYFYQIVYILVPFFKKPRTPECAPVANRYAVFICARDEETVIGNLIRSIRAQDYPRELIDVYVAADNCADNTARVCRELGATVYERVDTRRVGKGYALDFLFRAVRASRRADYDGYFVFDADNVLDERYFTHMNRVFSCGHRVVTSYRNSKNYGDNWITAGYSLWFLRESQYLNYPRMLLGTGCAISGTGFLLSRAIVEKYGGWSFFLLTEDIEFSVRCAIDGERIAMCRVAVLYDEQPATFRQSRTQRLRWAKGFFRVFSRYGGKLFAAMVRRRSFCCFDMLMTVMPAILLTLVTAFGSVSAAIYGALAGLDITAAVGSLVVTFVRAYALLLLVGAVTVATQWREIHAAPRAKVGYTFTFPLFMFTYLPIALSALVRNVGWEPIRHTKVKTLSDIRRLSV
jgi:cellulose synthase/poly-beta-1,6-N-acetylglucosamine synthase-like glycosyltransferase